MSSHRQQQLLHALDHVAHYLPAQGPIGVFIHHNTLHAFQHLPFHEAIAQAVDVFEVEGYLTDEVFAEHVAAGRIDESDIAFSLAAYRRERGESATPDPADLRASVEACVVRHRIEPMDEVGAAFRAGEHGWASLLPADLDPQVRRGLEARARAELTEQLERLGEALAVGAFARSLVPDLASARRSLDAPRRSARAVLVRLGLPVARVDAYLAGLARTHGASAEAHAVAEVAQLEAALVEVGAPGGTLAGLRALLERQPAALVASTLLAACMQVRADPAVEPVRANLLSRLGRDRTPRDVLVEWTGDDPATRVNGVLVRLLSAYLDEGLARRAMPQRQRGLVAAFRTFVGDPGGVPDAWQLALRARIARDAGRDAADVVLAALDELGVSEEHWETFLRRFLLQLPGWSGMVSRLERVPSDRPTGAPPASLLELCAVRLTLDVVAWEHAAREGLGHAGALSALAETARRAGFDAPSDGRIPFDEAWALFRVCQRTGRTAADLRAMPDGEREAVLDTLRRTRGLVRRRVLMEAYERHYYAEVLDGLRANRERGLATVRDPRAQVVCCIDDREESFVRAIEEVAPDFDVRSAAGFFGVPMYFRGLDDPTHAPLCPAVVVPVNEVVEAPREASAEYAMRRKRRLTLWGRMQVGFARASRQLAFGALFTPALGALALAPMVTRLLFPRRAAQLGAALRRRMLARPKTMLVTAAEGADKGVTGTDVGFTLDQKVTRVATLLENIGLVRGFADLVVLLGHGSSSMNNPHESAHDCGACGGRHGGPNARLFAHMANDPLVRERLVARGIEIPERTVFVGGQHDTANDDVHLYDEEHAEERHPKRFAEVMEVLDQARRISAHERCRRFEAAPVDPTPDQALHHVEARSEDLSQVRPEYGHCTNATAIVGRRALTRGLFLDRRAFLVSYDPSIDGESKILERTLAAVGPVGAGISLEYYFSFVDMDRLGCGTKLPHNVTGLIGVMEGSESDLRTGLPRQMTEVHEPVRLLLVCEATPETLLGICARQAEVKELVVNRWVEVVSLHPDTGDLWRFANGAFERYVPKDAPLGTVRSSRDWYRGKSSFVSPALIARPEAGQRAPTRSAATTPKERGVDARA